MIETFAGLLIGGVAIVLLYLIGEAVMNRWYRP